MVLRILLLVGWLLLPLAGLAYHLGPGQEQQALDVVAKHVQAAEAAAADNDHLTAVDEYNAALAALPAGRTAEARKLRLEKAKAQLLSKQLGAAYNDLTALADELADDPAADPKLSEDVRSARANAQFYVTWLLRLEGAAREDWEPEIEAARQNYKLLAEDAEKRGDAAAAAKHKEDLEAAVRLARLDLAELQGLPLPSV
ncbi:MAG: hypothetical protein K2X87_23110 [Gemmataceae bacterium]|nr:hypothetical protein [Gemmataceae bacterium]